MNSNIPEGENAMTVNRRTMIKGALAAGVAVLKVPAAPAQAAPLRVGFLTIKTGPLASGGLQMEQGLTVFFKERNNTLAGYAAKELKYKRVAGIADDFAFGNENVAGFQRVFEDNDGKVVQKLWTPLNAPDYGTYISQLKPDLDAVYTGHAGSNGFKFI